MNNKKEHLMQLKDELRSLKLYQNQGLSTKHDDEKIELLEYEIKKMEKELIEEERGDDER